jgi:uncharacterized protein (TIGR03435 family)
MWPMPDLRKTACIAALLSTPLCNAQLPSFDAASIKSSRAETAGRSLTRNPGARLTTSNATLKMLILFAWQVMPDQLSGGPSWLDSEGFDIAARGANPDATQAQFRQMVQALLADRFQLKVHTQTEERPVYLLTTAKNGTKLTEANEDGSEVSMRIEGPGRMAAVKATMPMFASSLSKPLGGRVIDETGLKGAYSFRLQFTPEKNTAKAGADDPFLATDAPSIFTALEEQLGLSLKSARRPVEILVIDHAERPAPN